MTAINDNGNEVLRKSAEEVEKDHNTRYILRTTAGDLYYTRQDQVTSQLTYYGATNQLDAATSDPVWRIWRVFTTGGGECCRNFAKDSGGSGSPNSDFVHVWDDRTALFDPVPFINSYSTLFDGVNDYFNGGDIFQYDNANAWSLSTWIKADNFAAQRCLYSKAGGASVLGWGLYVNASANLFLQMRASGQLRQHTGGITLSTLTWHHIAMTYNGGQNINGIRLYVDSVVDTTPASGVVTNTLLGGYNALFGARGAGFYWSGNFDEMSVWGKELSAAEVSTIYNSGSPLDVRDQGISQLVSFYRNGDGDTFSTVTDNQGSNDLTMVNMTADDFVTDVP